MQFSFLSVSGSFPLQEIESRCELGLREGRGKLCLKLLFQFALSKKSEEMVRKRKRDSESVKKEEKKRELESETTQKGGKEEREKKTIVNENERT